MLLMSILGIPFPTQVSAAQDISVLEEKVRALTKYLERERDKSNSVPLTSDELRASIKAGADWLKNAQEPNGHFKYEYIPYEHTYRDDDNIVRQTGTLYALGEILKRDKSDPYRIEDTVVRALSYFKSLSKTTDGGGRCVANTSVSTKCQLGATSLALAGLIDYLEYAPSKKSRYKKDVDEYRTFILNMQKENGGFRNQYRVMSMKQNDAESSFSNGEALLALVRSYEYEKRSDVKKAIDAAFAYLKDEPYDNNLYLWIMAALKDMNRLEPHAEYVSYAAAFSKWRIDGGTSYLTGARNTCAYAEGVASALSILRGKIPSTEFARYRNVLDRNIRLNRRFQLTESDTTRLFVSSTSTQFKSLRQPQFAFGGFLTSDAEPTERIDFTQHCLSASLQTLGDLDGDMLTK